MSTTVPTATRVPLDRPLRAGVVGLGWAGQQHMAAYDDLEGVELVGIAGMEAEPLARLGELYGVKHRVSTWQELVATHELDVISVATPTVLHAPIAIGALEAGIHVLSEKPMAETAEVGARMVAAAEANDRVLDVSFNHRMRGDVQALKKIIDAGLLGNIYYAKAGWLRREGIPGLGTWFTRAATSGGGPLMDIGVHMLDMALYLLGEPEVRAATAATYAEFGPRGKGGSPYGPRRETQAAQFDVEDLSTAFLRLGEGGTLLLESSWAQWIPNDQCYVAVYGADGGASLEWGGEPKEPYRRLSIWTEIEGVPAELNPQAPPDGGHRGSVIDFLAKVRSGDWAAHRGTVPLARAKVVDACYASARQGREVSLDGVPTA
ncbi:MAG TPA: Gfo/Idh/MocA family oxidoreductase [Microlunatus sp.]|nr:Gfo/Idh/MocA family oxidoreductase [Microlunatus sp.]